jgi:hypothetical protein
MNLDFNHIEVAWEFLRKYPDATKKDNELIDERIKLLYAVLKVLDDDEEVKSKLCNLPLTILDHNPDNPTDPSKWNCHRPMLIRNWWIQNQKLHISYSFIISANWDLDKKIHTRDENNFDIDESSCYYILDALYVHLLNKIRESNR